MRKIVASQYLSLDGVMEQPTWSAHYWNHEIARFKHDELFASDALLIGRITYEEFADVWPRRTDDEGFAERMNVLPKYVASQTRDQLEWNATLIEGDVVEGVTRLKQQDGQNMLIYGSAELVQTLRQADLIDEYRLLIYPIIVGAGKRFFLDGEQSELQLISHDVLNNGVVALVYKPAAQET
ncbi:MAG: dihydrofolate reductase family protein [Chloroflexota bacterium]|nr:dihydrofolate reductase family protein [Chloroflexota bacterium]